MSTKTKKLPTGTNAYAIELGKRMRLVRTKLGVSRELAATQIGISAGKYKVLENGDAIPATHITRRIEKWMFEGADFKGKPPVPYSRVPEYVKQKKYSLAAQVPEGIWIRIARESDRLGISITELTIVALERLLDNEPCLTTLEAAAERLKRANVAELLLEDPSIARILKGDMELALSLCSGRVTYQDDFEEEPIPLRRVVLAPLSPTDDWEEP